MNLKENIERIHEIMGGVITEESDSKKDALKSMIKQSGIGVTSKLMGGINNLMTILYDGDIMKIHIHHLFICQQTKSLYIYMRHWLKNLN
jgi:hypothetical protein